MTPVIPTRFGGGPLPPAQGSPYQLHGQPARRRDGAARDARERVERAAEELAELALDPGRRAPTLSGAVAAVSSEIGIATAATNHNTHHPMVTAAFAMTMHRLTEGRFSLGRGRGIAPIVRRLRSAAHQDGADRGLRRADAAHLARRGGGRARRACGPLPAFHHGPAVPRAHPPHVQAFGPNSLALGGRAFDAVVLHTFFTDDATARCVRAVKRAAERAGRDPASVRVWSCFATVGDHLPEALRLKKTVGRMATYLQG